MMFSVAVLLFLLANRFAVSLAKQECSSSGDCPRDRVCAANLCEDPCDGFCGENTSCQVKWQNAICRCLQGYEGDPMQGCTITDCKPEETTRKKKFEISTFKLNWNAAFANCQSRGMRLATIENKEQDDDFISLFRTSVSYADHASITWIGATDLGKEGDWYWMTTGQSIYKYKHWIGIEPNNWGGAENCMGYWKNNNEIGWCDYICSKECFFACEYY